MPHRNGTIAALIVLSLAHQARAQELDEMPLELPRLEAAERTPYRDTSLDEVPSGRDRRPPPPKLRPPQGAFWTEVAGGFTGLAIGITPVALVVGSSFGQGQSPYAKTALVASLIASPLLITAGVTLAGHLSGGNGSWFGALLGEAVGVSIFVLTEQTLRADGTVYVSWLTLTTIGGAILGYRLTATDEPDTFAALSPSLDGRGATFTLSGAL